MRRSRLSPVLAATFACTPTSKAPDPAPDPASTPTPEPPEPVVSPDVGSVGGHAFPSPRCVSAPYVEALRTSRSWVRVGETIDATVVAGIDGWDELALMVDPPQGLTVGSIDVEEVQTPAQMEEMTVLRWQRYTFPLQAEAAGRYTIKLGGPCFDEVDPQQLTVRAKR